MIRGVSFLITSMHWVKPYITCPIALALGSSTGLDTLLAEL